MPHLKLDEQRLPLTDVQIDGETEGGLDDIDER